MTASIESPIPERSMTPKGLAIRVNASRPAYVVFDTDLLRYSVGWTDGSLDFHGVDFDGEHRSWPKIVGNPIFGTRMIPGWAHAGSFDDPRQRFPSTDYTLQPPSWRNRGYGPLPHDWAQYKGLYLHGQQVVLSYTVSGTPVLDSPGWEESADGIITRTLNVGKSSGELVLNVLEHPTKGGGIAASETLAALAPQGSARGSFVVLGELNSAAAKASIKPVVPVLVAAIGSTQEMMWELTAQSQLRLHIPAGATPANIKILIGRAPANGAAAFVAAAKESPAPADLSQLTHGGPPRWSQKLTTSGTLGANTEAYVVDTLALPFENPWHARMRPGGFDFFKDGRRAAVCTWDGDVWIVDGLDGAMEKLTWSRIATGMFQPLGLKIVPDAAGVEQIYVCCRDQITRLHDLNGDGETDFYECFNNDHQVTEHFHEFAMGLQTDAAGNFYYTKGARHALDSVVPQHGTLLKVTPDGSKTEIVCNGFRAANGFALGPQGEMAATDQEGFWTPANRIDLVKPGGFYGNMWSYHGGKRTPADGYDPPMCWMPVPLDRSPAEEVWVTSDKWGPLQGKMVHTSYGTGNLFLAPYEFVNGVPQGGVVPFPGIKFPTGGMRARFHPIDGQLYVCGLVGWSSNCTAPGGFYRVRYTGKNPNMPIGLEVKTDGIAIGFTDPLDKALAEDRESYAVQQWQYRWTANYGSKHYSIANPDKLGQDEVQIAAATLSPNGKRVFLTIAGLKPVMQMQIDMQLKSKDGNMLHWVIHNTINQMPKK
ncbi:MAG TPA: DUF6797 domain-containing protein [Humisphaera sp.]|nr:DUF6797 domain-containing protein [Humisphaera sp.]